MKRRSKAGREQIKGRRRKAAKPERRNALKAVPHSNSSPAAPEVARLTRELNEALGQQTATTDVLRLISSSPGDLEKIFDALLHNAMRVCHANFGNLALCERDGFRNVAIQNTVPALDKFFRGALLHPHPESPLSLAAGHKRPSHIVDLRETAPYLAGNKPIVMLADVGGARTFLSVPMLKQIELAGVINLYRTEIRPFTDKQIELVQNFAAQAVIAIENARLLNELRQRTTDLTEALEQQTATSDVLKVISGSPGELKPVFDAMLESATRICDATFGSMALCDGDAYRRVALHNAPEKFSEYSNNTPIIRRGMAPAIDRAIHTQEVVHIRDLEAENPNEPIVKFGSARTILGVPMLKENEAIGVIAIYRQEVRPFTDKQIELVKNFATQAVIAIENARLLIELRQSLAQQTATADVLKVISRSTFDLQTVLNTLVLSATSLCVADMSAIYQRDGEFLRLWATTGVTPEAAQYGAEHPLQVGRNSASGRAALEGEAVHILDVLADAEYSATSLRDAAGYRTVLGVPLLRAGTVIGVFALTRREVSPFSEKQIELVTTFAAQAVIAIENARLLNELRQRTTDLSEALEQQTATADVLGVISSFPGELEPVFAAMVEKAVRICEALFGNIYRWDGMPSRS